MKRLRRRRAESPGCCWPQAAGREAAFVEGVLSQRGAVRGPSSAFVEINQC